MSAKERVLLIRLAEKIARHPEYARRIGIELVDAKIQKSEDDECHRNGAVI